MKEDQQHKNNCECFDCFKKQYEGVSNDYLISCLHNAKKELKDIWKAVSGG